MLRLAHTICFLLLTTLALVAYGVKEETHVMRYKLQELQQERREAAARIAILDAEWRRLTSPDALRALSRRVYGADALQDRSGAALAPATLDQVHVLRRSPESLAFGETAALAGTADRREGAQ